MKLHLVVVGAAILSLATSGALGATNLISNGSFENGLTGWSINGTNGDGYTPVVIDGSPSGYPNGAFGEAIPVDNAPSLSPDAALNHSLYFVSDLSNGQSVSQSFNVAVAGIYQVGFDVYAPQNGLNNPNDGTFEASAGPFDTGLIAISSLPATTWVNYSTNGFLGAGSYTVSFSFNTGGIPAKDITIDRVYVMAAAVPEPSIWTTMLVGFFGVGFVLRRSRNASPLAIA